MDSYFLYPASDFGLNSIVIDSGASYTITSLSSDQGLQAVKHFGEPIAADVFPNPYA